MLSKEELSQLKTILQSLSIDLPQEIELEVAGIAILRFCLAKSLREHNTNLMNGG